VDQQTTLLVLLLDATVLLSDRCCPPKRDVRPCREIARPYRHVLDRAPTPGAESMRRSHRL
jgi:hypothetical protein